MAAPFESSARDPRRELLGTVSSRGGELLIIDFGLLEFWSGEATPQVTDDRLDPSLTEAMNGYVDHELIGADAGRAAELVDMAAVNGTYVFDVPAHDEVLAGRLREIRKRCRLDVELLRIPRMPHRERVRRLLEQRPNGTEVNFFGNTAVAVGGLPVGKELPLYGERMGVGSDYADRWRSVWVEVENAPVAETAQLGRVFVDEARLLFSDPDVLSSWTTGAPLDGLADLLFWGRDEESVAAELGAEQFEESGQALHGWTDLPVEQVQDLRSRLVDLRSAREALFVVDYRPHDDHHRLLSAMRQARTGSAGVDVAETAVCGLFTTWGDGAFPVYLDLASGGRLLRVRVELGAPEIVTRQRRVEELWFGELSKSGVATRAVLSGSPVRWLERGAPYVDRDSGWSFYAGTESEEDLSDPEESGLVALREIIQRQPDLEALLTAPPPAAFEIGEDQTWHPIAPSSDD